MNIHAARAELAWQQTILPYQLWPCVRCRSHERWREWSQPDGEGGYYGARSTWGCQCRTSAGGDWSWDVWLFLAGRGTGKTRTGGNFALRQASENPGSFGAVIAPTHSDLRRIVLEGESGLLRTIPRELVVLTKQGEMWNKAAAQIELKNGSIIRTLAAEKPDRIRGENLTWVWADELAAWTRLDYAWEQLELATRKGAPKFFISTTPRPLPILKMLMKMSGTAITRASTFDNPNLSVRFLQRMRETLDGTRVGRQELYGEVLEDVDGALWTWEMVEDARLAAAEMPPLDRIVVAVDPSGGGSAEVGIVVVGVRKGVAYVIADWSMRGTPDQWGNRVVEAYHTFQADKIVGERNFGGDMVEAVVMAADRNVPYKDVNASRGKRQRAEPVSTLFEKHRVKLVGNFDVETPEGGKAFPELENQLTGWVPDTGMASPDRLDAMVWAVTELLLGGHGLIPSHLLVAPDGVGKSSPWRQTGAGDISPG